jgi:hypothetical protein
MNGVVASGSGESNAVAGFHSRMAMALLLGLAGCGACAVENEASPAPVASLVPAASVVAALDERPRLQLEVSASSLPRFDNTDGSNRASRVDMIWLPQRRSALGLSFGMTSPDGGGAFYPTSAFAGASSSVDLGLHWRYSLDGHYRIDITAWRGVVSPGAFTLVQMVQPSYGARVEMQIRPVPKSGFVADRGFIGFQLESGARVTLRRTGGKPMLYYRTRF